MSNDIIRPFGETVFSNIADVGLDYTQLTIDELLGLKELQGLPLVRTIASIANVGLAIRERVFAKKTIIFAQHLKDKSLSQEEVQKRIVALKNGDDWIYKELEIIISSIDRLDRDTKAIIEAIIYRKYVNGEMNPSRFEEYLSITERLFLQDLKELKSIYEYENRPHYDDMIVNNMVGQKKIGGLQTDRTPVEQTVACSRLQSIGLISPVSKPFTEYKLNELAISYKLSHTGKWYSKMLMDEGFLNTDN